MKKSLVLLVTLCLVLLSIGGAAFAEETEYLPC